MADTITRSVYELLAIDKTKGAFTSVKANFEESKSHIMGWKTELLAALGVGGLAEMIKSAADTGEQMGRLSDRLRISTEDMYAFTRAAQISGVSQDSMTAALDKMEKSIGQAAQGSGTAKKYFEEWGISIADIAKMNAAQQFDLISSKIKGLGNEAEQAAATTAVFGKSATELQNMWGPAGHSMEEVKGQMEAVNASMSRFDASRVTQANEALGDLMTVAKGVANVIAESLAPYVKALATYFTDSAVAAGGWKTQITSAIDTVMGFIGTLADGLHGISIIFTGLEVIAYGFVAAVVEVGNILLHAILEPVNLIDKGINMLIDKMNQLAGTKFQKIDTSNIDNALKTSSDLAQSMQEAVINKEDELQKKLMEPLPSETMQDAVSKASQQMNKLANDTVVAHNKMLEQTVTPIHPTAEELAKIQEQWNKYVLVTDSAFKKEQDEFATHSKWMQDNKAILISKGITTEISYNHQIEVMNKKHQDNLDKIAQEGELTREKFAAASWKAQTHIVLDSLMQMTDGVSNTNKTMFEINKVAGIANAIIHTIEGVTQALAAYPPPISWAMAAITLAAGLAQVEAIRNTSFGGGTTPSIAGSTATYNGQPVYETQNVTPGSQTNGTSKNGGTAVQHTVIINSSPNIDARGSSPEVLPMIAKAVKASEDRVLGHINERLSRGNMPG